MSRPISHQYHLVGLRMLEGRAPTFEPCLSWERSRLVWVSIRATVASFMSTEGGGGQGDPTRGAPARR